MAIMYNSDIFTHEEVLAMINKPGGCINLSSCGGTLTAPMWTALAYPSKDQSLKTVNCRNCGALAMQLQQCEYCDTIN